MCKVVVLFVLSVCTAAVAGAQVDTRIVPWEGRTTWAPGVQGDIPTRSTVCATLKAADFGNGGLEASAAFRRPSTRVRSVDTVRTLCGQVPHQSPCVAQQGHHPSWRRTWNQTKLMKTNGARVNDYRLEDASPIIVVGPNRWPKSGQYNVSQPHG